MMKKKNRKQDDFDLKKITTAIDQHFYRLQGRTPVRCTLAEYAQCMQNDSNRIVKQTEVDGLNISTIFTGIDRNFGSGSPLLFETVVFGLPEDLHPQWGHSTWEEAMEQHQRLVESINERGVSYLRQEILNITDQPG